MALLLAGERASAASFRFDVLSAIAVWLKRARIARERRTAFATLLTMDESRLDDIGISRRQLLDALKAERKA